MKKKTTMIFATVLTLAACGLVYFFAAPALMNHLQGGF